MFKSSQAFCLPTIQAMSNIKTASHAQGCMLGQFTGDALGSLVEFQSVEAIARLYPNGVRTIHDGGTWNTIAGQPTDDSELALCLLRTLLETNDYQQAAVLKAYQYWLSTNPFDCGLTIRQSLLGDPNPESQANGALMRISPLAVFAIHLDEAKAADYAEQDARLTHINPVCIQINQLFVLIIRHILLNAGHLTTHAVYDYLYQLAITRPPDTEIIRVIIDAKTTKPTNYVDQQGWVMIAFQNAIWQLLHADNFEEAIVDTIMQGGDTDTNAAICGALLGAFYGIDAVPEQWKLAVLTCQPDASYDNVIHPRPKYFWPTSLLSLTDKLLALKS